MNLRLKDDLKSATEKSFLHAATFHWLNNEHEKAREYIKYVMENQPQFLPAQMLLGWIDLTCKRENLVKKSGLLFEKVISQGNRKDIDALLGKAKYLEYMKQYSQSLDIINQIIVLFSWFLPALTEKAKLLLMMGDWDQAYETSQRVVSQVSAFNFLN